MSNPMEELDKNVEFFSIETMRQNEKAADFTRTAMSVISGCIAGIMGLTGLSGFALMAALYMITSFAFLGVKLGMNLKVYFNMSIFGFVFHGIGSHFLSFILFWTLAYGLVHIY